MFILPSQYGGRCIFGEANRSNNEVRNCLVVVSLLRQPEWLLSSQVHRNAATVSPPSVETNISSDRTLPNFRSLFSRYSVRGTAASSPVTSLGQLQPRASSAPRPKGKRTGGPFFVKETWTHDFVCLANHQQPSRTENFQLQETGLGSVCRKARNGLS